jgi:hypothetical protein
MPPPPSKKKDDSEQLSKSDSAEDESEDEVSLNEDGEVQLGSQEVESEDSQPRRKRRRGGVRSPGVPQKTRQPHLLKQLQQQQQLLKLPPPLCFKRMRSMKVTMSIPPLEIHQMLVGF